MKYGFMETPLANTLYFCGSLKSYWHTLSIINPLTRKEIKTLSVWYFLSTHRKKNEQMSRILDKQTDLTHSSLIMSRDVMLQTSLMANAALSQDDYKQAHIGSHL